MRASLPTNVRSGQRLIRWPDRSSSGAHSAGMSITIASFDGADPAAVDAAYRIGAAANDADRAGLPAAVCRRRFDALFHTPMPGTRSLWALARLGRRAGRLPRSSTCRSSTTPTTPPSSCCVHPEQRRRGRRPGAARVRACGLLREHGRKRVVGDGRRRAARRAGPSVAGDAFAAAMGAQPALAEVRRRLDVDHARPGRATTRRSPRPGRGPRATARSAGRAPTPQEYVADVAYLDGRLITDAPMGDLEWEPEQVDADRIRGIERRWTRGAGGATTPGAARRDRPAGRLDAARTSAPPPTGTRWQQITIVDPAHRGHRLGLIVKVENLRHLLAHEPAAAGRSTPGTRPANSYMIAINEAARLPPGRRLDRLAARRSEPAGTRPLRARPTLAATGCGMMAGMTETPHPLYARHADTLDRALTAITERGYWSAYPESPSPRVYGETAAADGKAAFEAYLGGDFPLDQPGTRRPGRHRGEPVRGRRWTCATRTPDADELLAAAAAALPAWRDAGPQARVGRLPGDPRPAAQAHLRAGQRGAVHHRPGVRDGLPGRRRARAGPGAGGDRLRVRAR